MKINNINFNDYTRRLTSTSHGNKLENKDNPLSRDSLTLGEFTPETLSYDKTGTINNVSLYPNEVNIDKGTAVETTIFVNRESFDRIVDYSTFNEPKWDELGWDDNKRWVVINGQRFEVEHTPEEKAMRKRMKRSFVEILNDLEKENEDVNKMEVNSSNKDKLKENDEVLNLLEKVFGTSSFDELWHAIL